MWYAKPTGGYSTTSDEAKTNATNIANVLTSQGWSVTAIAALLGNATGESGLNPWRWESDYIPSISEFNNWTPQQASSHGYGLFGFTPASNYINANNESRFRIYGYSPNFSNSQGNALDGQAQTMYFVETVQQNWTHNLYSYYEDDFANIGVDISTFYYATFNEFINANINGRDMTLAECVGAFELCYEKPADWAAANSYQSRVDSANYWYQYFTNEPPTPTPPIITRHTLPIWMYLF